MRPANGERRPTSAQFRKWRSGAYADFSAQKFTNKRAAHCRLCDCAIPKGAAVGYIEFMEDGYRASDRFVCASCEAATRPECHVELPSEAK